MSIRRTGSTVLRCMIVYVAGLSVQVSAQSASPHKGGLDGDWEVRVSSDERQRTSILSFSKHPEGGQFGQWISFWGVSELEKVKYEEGEISFTREGRNREGQSTTWKVAGTIKGDKLSGTASSNGDKYKLEGKRIPSLPDVVGDFAFSYGDEGVGFALAVRINKEGRLAAEWQTADGEVPVTDLKYEKGKLTFNSKLGSYEGRLRNGNLDGTYTTDRGPYSVLASRMGTPIIGTWNLDVTSEQRSRKQRLKINPDMSGWYGAIPIKRVHLEGDNPQESPESHAVRFKAVMEFGERTFEMDFAGKVAGSKLTGEITTSRGSAKVVGKRAVQASRTRTRP